MRIGIVCYPSLGGSGVVATELGHALAKRGHEIHFIAYDTPFRLRLDENNIFFHEVEIHQYDLFKYPDYALTLAVKIAEVANRCQLDLLHVHYAIPHATSAFLANQLLGKKHLPVMTTLHGTDINLVGKKLAYFDIVKFSIEKSDCVTAVSESLKNQTCQYFDICSSIEVIPNFFVPRADCLHKPLRHLFVSDQEKLLLHSSNYRSVKRAVDVVRIFMKVRKQIPCRLLFLGSGAEIEEVRSFVHQHALKDVVHFIGRSRNIDPYVSSADLFLLPSSQESFGLAALEALAYGVPVIASRVGGLPEVVDNGKTGFLSEVGDVEQMAKHAIDLLTDDALYADFSREASKQAAEKFSLERIVPVYEKMYEKTVKSASTYCLLFLLMLCYSICGYAQEEVLGIEDGGQWLCEALDKKVKLKKKQKPLCLIYGNCQLSFVYEYLKANFPRYYQYVTVTNFSLLRGQDAFPVDLAKRADLFIYQPLQGHGEKDTEWIKTHYLKSTCAQISIPYIYFLGYFPDFFQDERNVTTMTPQTPFGIFPYGSKKLKELIEQGCTVSQMIEKSCSDDFIPKEEIFNKFYSSLNILREREMVTNIKLSHFIERHFRKRRLFFSTNHPTNFLLKELIRQVLVHMNLPTKNVKKNLFFEDEFFANWTSGVIYPCVAKALDLQFDISHACLKDQSVLYPIYVAEYMRNLYPEYFIEHGM